MQDNTYRKRIGSQSERLACDYLEDLGYKILKTNCDFGFAEADIIAQDGEAIVFCEVKYRATGKFGYAIEAVSKMKQELYIQMANVYLSELENSDVDIRFDIIAITGLEFEHIINAYTA